MRKIRISIILIFVFCIMACGGRGFFAWGEASWKEEVLLHDGNKIIIERFVNLGGYPTIDSHERQDLDETVTFTLPGTNKEITWKTDFRDSKPEPNSLNLLALDIINGIPYIATYPAGCIAYNKWKRPNPPYIFFKYDGNVWKQIPLEEFPSEISKVNVIVGRPPAELQKPFYIAEQVYGENNRGNMNETYKKIIRTSMKGVGCPEEVYGGNGKWYGIDWFSDQPSYEACLNFCKSENIDAKYCQCDKLFKGNKKRQ